MDKRKIMHPLLGEIDPVEGPSVLDDETTITPDKPIPPAFVSQDIETPVREPLKKRALRRLLVVIKNVRAHADYLSAHLEEWLDK